MSVDVVFVTRYDVGGGVGESARIMPPRLIRGIVLISAVIIELCGGDITGESIFVVAHLCLKD